MQELTVRCSSLPTACACAQATRAPAVKVDTSDASARVGTAVHAVLANFRAGEWQERDEQIAAAYYDVDPDEVAMLCAIGRKFWRERLSDLFPDPITEEALSAQVGPAKVAGHPDYYSVLGAHARVGDDKTGFADGEHFEQVRGYGLLVLRKHPEVETVQGVVCRLRDGTLEAGPVWTRAEVEAHFERHAKEWAKDDPPYRPGRHCGFCPRRSECPAAQRALSESVLLFAPGPHGEAPGLAILDPETRPSPLSPLLVLGAYERLQAVEGACKLAREHLRRAVEAAGGTISDGERELALVTKQVRQVVPSVDLMTALERLIGIQEICGAISLSLTKLCDAAREQAPRGQKKEAAEELAAALDGMGALVTTSRKELRLRRAIPVITTGETNGNDHTATTAAVTDQR